MQYDYLGPIARSEAEAILDNGNEEDVSLVLIRLALNDPDPSYVQEICLALSSDPRVWVRRNCATCFGHLARLHRTLDLTRVMPILLSLSTDEDTKGWAEASLDDINIFMRPPEH
jgi:hypothetical protein